ncbi:Z1 domain-containing protein [Pseudomonas asgharzadehiana]|uniref:Z1 domain-containing protein n=1 Tax=Pseudomonas asgharzadehiana TaxID=2842349 RepID=A0ABX8NZG4_9PSED|nr:Z1 domain-containing protein [Pseudomonas asgharzadehiana]QXH66724.1 Z1 domain-containing protein [Pseudomonas asgharzadehiana]
MFDSELAYFRSIINKQHGEDIAQGQGLPEGAITSIVRNGPFQHLGEPAINAIIRELEASFTVTQKRGAVITKGHRPWLATMRPALDFYYWNRLRKYYLETGTLPSPVLATLDSDTDEILDQCGNPKDELYGAVRGMVMGNVQSGKTTNYSALICKAADAGYRVIILLAGITNSLRAQTQERIDETFIGKVSMFGAAAQQSLPIQNYAATRRIPSYGTTRVADFSSGTDGIYFGLSGHQEPMIFITKKNKSILERLAHWIEKQGETGGYDLPLLLIDDEADNASINTATDPKRTTAINGIIRQILSRFPRSAYIGYTATPFANIFIDPETTAEMETDDLFPGNFIKALDPPTNYAGSHRVFREGGDLRSSMVKVIDDYRALLPLRHKSGDNVADIPESLRHAIRVFCITRAIRVFQDKGKAHCSMMINVSRFNAIQDKILGLVYEYLTEIKDAVSVHASLPLDEINDEIMAHLENSFTVEFGNSGLNWRDLLEVLNEGVQSIEVRTVNMRGGKLDYSLRKSEGLHVIAIGGLALSRGLTLEGLTISYLLRNATASDTLMQMARWFGYRPGYEEYCRLYLPQVSFDHYEFVDEATEELRSEIKRMQAARRTPRDFGLKVRQSPLAIRVTAANKMRTAEKLKIAQDYSARHIEGFALPNDPVIGKAHRNAVEKFLIALGSPTEIHKGYIHWAAGGRDVLSLMREFQFVDHPDLSVISDTSLLGDYVQDRVTDELEKWDVVLPMRQSGDSTPFAGQKINLRSRDQGTVQKGTYRVYGSKNRVADPGDAQIGLSDPQKAKADAAYRAETYKKERAACSVRERPMMLVHVFNAKLRDDRNDRDEDLKLNDPIVTLSFCMPETGKPAKERTYQVNAVYRQQLEHFAAEEDDDSEAMMEAQDA